jgi:hypothetical protein
MHAQGKIDADALKTTWISYFEFKSARVPALTVAKQIGNKQKVPDVVLQQFYTT